MIDYNNELNSEQVKVITDGDGACLVLAGAGSGKTRTITYRVAHLLEQGVNPENILLVTFTNKASREMLTRVQEITRGETRLPWAGTFHSIAFKILKRRAVVLGYSNNFTVLDSEDSRDLIKICVKQEGVQKTGQKFPSTKVLQSIFSFSRNSEMGLQDVINLKYPHFLNLRDDLGHIFNEYEKRKKLSNSMDFDDLLINFYRLLQSSPEMLDYYAGKFKYVLVDEYQDTNKIQDSIINLLASVHKNILVVGDDAQSIYSFRAANVNNILDFPKKYEGTKIFKLETNYRSTPNILGLANDVIEKNLKQFRKVLKSHREVNVTPELNSFYHQKNEAEYIADKISEFQNDGIKKIAVLFRSTHHSQALEMELNSLGIDYEYRGGIRFFERAHIKDVLAFLRIYSNPKDMVSWNRVLNMQSGIGLVTAQKIIAIVKDLTSEELISAEIPMSARAKIGWGDFVQIWKDIINVQAKKPGTLIEAILSSIYVQYLKSEYDNYRERVQDIEQLVSFAEKYDNLGKFLAESALQEGNARKDMKKERNEDAVILSTIHQAKGLEWDVVFIINLAAGQFPNERAMREKDGLEEERRLFYVAITRAKTHLFMTYSESGGFGNLFSGPSLFIGEMNSRNLTDERCRETSVFTDPSDDIDEISYVPFDDDIPKHSSFLKSIDEL
ncbi:MAG: ATP-dependent helicase [Candidatus Magasanikbacteria bacterium]|nr:ATP-dependent helicase [Candidatus Magasanikbacteria bacterium]